MCDLWRPTHWRLSGSWSPAPTSPPRPAPGLPGDPPGGRRDEGRDDRPHVCPGRQGVDGSQGIDRTSWGMTRIRAVPVHGPRVTVVRQRKGAAVSEPIQPPDGQRQPRRVRRCRRTGVRKMESTNRSALAVLEVVADRSPDEGEAGGTVEGGGAGLLEHRAPEHGAGFSRLDILTRAEKTILPRGMDLMTFTK